MGLFHKGIKGGMFLVAHGKTQARLLKHAWPQATIYLDEYIPPYPKKKKTK